jgi:Pectate lyase superfamily protein
MPLKSIPQIGDSNWGTPLNNHLSQLQNPTTGGINTFDQFSQRPTNLTADDQGKTYLYNQTGNLHQWTGAIWKVLNESVINVKDYGAIGDGVVDDTVVIQTLIDYYSIYHKYGGSQYESVTLFFPQGNYQITNTLTVDIIAKALQISFCGETGSNLRAVNFSNKILLSVNSNRTSVLNLGFEFVGNRTTNNTAIKISGGFFELDNVNITGQWDKGIFCSRALVSKILNCFIRNEKAEISFDPNDFIGVGIYADYSVNVFVSNCQLEGWDKAFYFSDLQFPGGGWCEGWMIGNCETIICNYAIYAEHMIYLGVTNCVLDYNAVAGLVINNGSSSRIHGNWFGGPALAWNKSNFSVCIFGAGVLQSSFQNNSAQVEATQSTNPTINSVAFDIDGRENIVTGNTFLYANGGSIKGSDHIVNQNITKTPITFTNNTPTFNINKTLEFTNNANAILGGLKIGDLYRTGDFLKIVY